MKRFAQLLNALYFTYGNLAKLNLLKNYLAATPDPERGYALAILANALEFPTFKRSIIRDAIHERIDPFLFNLSYDYVGDLSDTLALLWPASLQEQAELPPLSEVIHTFNQLPENKIPDYLIQLLNRSNPTERWALLKLGTGSLRIGISARFVKKTLAEYGQVDVKQIEKLWHGINPPYTELLSWLDGKNSHPVITQSLFFHPVMLSHPLQEKDHPQITPDDFLIEPKYDGIRIQIVCNEQGKALFSRTGDNINTAFPDVLQAINTTVILDGELIVGSPAEIGSFNELQQRLNRKKPDNKILEKYPAGVILFDILSSEGTPLDTLPFVKRRACLEAWFAKHHPANMWLSEMISFREQDTLAQIRSNALKRPHIEGLMLKRKNSPYIPGRPKGHWYKWKREPFLLDAVLMYAQRGHGKRSSYYSDYTFGLWSDDKLLPIGKAYFGFTDEELYQLDKWIRAHIMQRFGPVLEVSKELVFEIAFDAVNFSSRHKSGVALRFPRIHRIRWDKPALEADHLSTLLTLIDSRNPNQNNPPAP
ncbi:MULTISPECIES: cisplatin damage response ATP-dependent DNA ligase [Legionella]|uniref:DNA ligase (ATP) n=1 Tax=Legionella septentrionalis TaxID=2498109 RepID=A0A433JI19_9GAMM|nr:MULTISPECIES: cisplatin damage response ATP-dependent DNA ligase [Legionella]MCP0912962.1 cisplatin damage response ATP-dependent DNA ligase [Legionella sp. 27cVA30]RUQ84507.1 cisplatin damage response ATP-dependent DNA ligase [Legionella septentrionalis]RUQ96746.1 cisplatin damage response ATP-dependent DNA ligase [Legionella septentrionalis]RUR10149.1 cisplatin damage response ATP-dependent DNA ligase [Legionella septentrionalis]RUR15459.1 cisplatin damage response ATP-dependent DNA ligas